MADNNKKRKHVGPETVNSDGAKIRKNSGSGGGGGNRWIHNPSRGRPGFFITCERGRESKARRDAIEILKYYLDLQNSKKAKKNEKVTDENDDDDDDDELTKPSTSDATKQLSFDDELKMLQQQNKKQNESKQKNNNTFDLFEMNCRGLLFMMCTLPGCEMVPTTDASLETTTTTTESQTTSSTHTKSVNNGSETKILWDPINTFHRIYLDWKAEAESNKKMKQNDQSIGIADVKVDAPSSRYISRMIPIQVTCFSSVDDITTTIAKLATEYYPAATDSRTSNSSTGDESSCPATFTFAVSVKLRNCTTITKSQVIDIVAGHIIRKYGTQVQLDRPDVTIVVEICQTLCGMSIIDNRTMVLKKIGSIDDHNFNLAMLKQE